VSVAASTQFLDQVELMARQQHRAAAPRLLAQHLADRVDAPGVEPRERLVEDEQVGLVHERHSELDALLVAVGERLDLRLGALGDAEPLEALHG
jgi:hypothetical protein